MHNLTILIKPVSSRCDLACDYCFYNRTADERGCGDRGFMTEKTAFELIAWALNAKPRSLSFVFQGGEPLIRGLDFYRVFTAEVKLKNICEIPISYAIQTNGCTITEEYAKFFADEKFLVGISLDATKEIHDSLRKDMHGNGSYEKADCGAEILRKHNVDFNILTVLSSEVCAAPEESWKALSPYKHLQFIPYISHGAGDAHTPSDLALANFLTYTFKKYAECALSNEPISVRDFDGYVRMLLGNPLSSCASGGGCGGYLAVEADGSVYPCDFYMDDAHFLGNIHESSAKSLLASEKFTEFLRDGIRINAECTDCRFLALCGCGCPRLRNERSVYGYCAAYKEFFSRTAGDILALAKEFRKRSCKK